MRSNLLFVYRDPVAYLRKAFRREHGEEPALMNASKHCVYQVAACGVWRVVLLRLRPYAHLFRQPSGAASSCQ
jgi:hypothetical protein